MAGAINRYRESISIEMSSDTDEEGARVIKAKVSGDRKLFSAVTLLEERGAVTSMEERIKEAIEKEVIESLRDVDAFFKLIKSSKGKRKKKSSKLEKAVS